MSVGMEFVTIDFQRPPIALFFFDVTLHNDHAEARWFLLPDEGARPRSHSYVIDTVDVYKLGNNEEVTVGHFSGPHGFFALLVPANRQIVLEAFPIMTVEEDLPDTFIVEIVATRNLTIGTEPIEAFLGTQPLSLGEAGVSAEPLADQLDVVFSWSTPNKTGTPVVFEVDERFRLVAETR